ncbi:MAG: hypothetical protein QUS11_07630 [Candidatus Fermentibacter sp.]|nr:hypothetical protein [Candidatus Fermentibacter sp.]
MRAVAVLGSILLLLPYCAFCDTTTGWNHAGDLPPIYYEMYHVSVACAEPEAGLRYVHTWSSGYVADGSGWSVQTFPDFWPFVVESQDPGISSYHLELINFAGDKVMMIGIDDGYESGPALVFQIRAANGWLLEPTTFVDWMPAGGSIHAACDSNCVVHVVRQDPDGLEYLAFDPATASVLWTDSIATTGGSTPAVAVGDMVHVIFNGSDGLTDYVQYDLEGNRTLGPSDVIDPSSQNCRLLSLALHPDGDPMAFFTLGPDFVTCRIDQETGQKVFGPLTVDGGFQAAHSTTEILSCRNGAPGFFYLLWTTDGDYVYFSVMDSDGNLVYTPPYAFFNGWQSHIMMRACTSSDGWIFATDCYDIYFPTPWPHTNYYPEIWFFTPGLGVEGDDPGPVQYSIRPSSNPFSSTAVLELSGPGGPVALSVFDMSGRRVRTMPCDVPGEAEWDGRDGRGMECPAGVYTVVAESPGHLTECSLVKL